MRSRGTSGKLRIVRVLLPIALACSFLSLAVFATNAHPVLLVYGFQPIPGFRATQIWEAMAEYLSGGNVVDALPMGVDAGHTMFFLPAVDEAHLDVYISDYALALEPTARDIAFYASRLAREISIVASRSADGRLDLVAHSIGGLIARAYIESDDIEPLVGSDEVPQFDACYGGEIRTLITLATPHHGIYFIGFGQWINTLGKQLTPGSRLLDALNEDHVDNGCLLSLQPDVRYVSLAGQTCFGCGLRRDQDACIRDCVSAGLAWQGSDLVVLMASAFLPEATNVACIGMDHVDMRTSPVVCSAVREILKGDEPPAAICEDPQLLEPLDQ